MTTFQQYFVPIFGGGLAVATIASIAAGLVRGWVIPALIVSFGILAFWAGLFFGSDIGYREWQAIPNAPREAYADTFPLGALFAGWLPGGAFCAAVFGVTKWLSHPEANVNDRNPNSI